MATIRDVAAAAGVNASTVSRVFNGHKAITDETKKLIYEVSDKIGYIPKEKKITLSIIGVIVPEINSLYYSELVHVLENRINESGYNMLIAISGFNEKRIIQSFETMNNHAVKGIICADYCVDREGHCKVLNAARRLKPPVIFLTENGMDIQDFNNIEINTKMGLEYAVSHLLELGHTRIGFIGDELSAIRFDKFVDCMKSSGVPVLPRYTIIGKKRFESGGYEMMKALLGETELPTAIIASYDQIAFGAMKAINEAGLITPDDISIVGFDNTVIGQYLPKKLTSITNPVASMVQVAVRILFSKISDTEDNIIQHVLLQPTLIIRDSTGLVRKNGNDC